MSTYSLTLRQQAGRRLSISEVDNNWLYLKELALSATGSGGIGGGTVSGLTESYGVTYSGYLITDWSPLNKLLYLLFCSSLALLAISITASTNLVLI